MSTLREQIDNLDPEKYARDALASARSAKQRADALGLPLPESVRKLLEIPETELARRRAKAIETAAQASSRESRPAPEYPAARGADRVHESNLNFAPEPNPESVLSQQTGNPDSTWTTPSIADILAYPSNYAGIDLIHFNETLLSSSRTRDAVDAARAALTLSTPDFSGESWVEKMSDSIQKLNAIPNPVGIDFHESLVKNWPTLIGAQRSSSAINKGDTILIVFAESDTEETGSNYAFYANVVDHANIGNDEEEVVVDKSGHEIRVPLQDPRLRVIEVVANSISRTIPK